MRSFGDDSDEQLGFEACMWMIKIKYLTKGISDSFGCKTKGNQEISVKPWKEHFQAKFATLVETQPEELCSTIQFQRKGDFALFG